MREDRGEGMKVIQGYHHASASPTLLRSRGVITSIDVAPKKTLPTHVLSCYPAQKKKTTNANKPSEDPSHCTSDRRNQKSAELRVTRLCRMSEVEWDTSPIKRGEIKWKVEQRCVHYNTETLQDEKVVGRQGDWKASRRGGQYLLEGK